MQECDLQGDERKYEVEQMKAVVKNALIRGHEVKTNKNGGQYVLVRYEDETGKPETLVDKEIERADFYTRDKTMDLYINIDIGRNFTNIRIIDAKEI
jgi:DNA polymerase III alpha subunit